MKRSRRWQRISKVARADERRVAKEMVLWKEEVQRQEARLAQLMDFCLEYRQRFLEAGRSGIDGRQLQGYHAFMAQLDDAIQQQQRRIAQLRETIERQHMQWEQYRRRAQILDKVVQRHLRKEILEEEGREQAEADDRPKRDGHS